MPFISGQIKGGTASIVPYAVAYQPSGGEYSAGVLVAHGPSPLSSPLAREISGVMHPRGFLFDYYNGIWMIPDAVVMENPEVGQTVSVLIWNAQISTTTTLTDITSPFTALGFDLSVGDVLDALEGRNLTITLEKQSPSLIGDIEFTFTNANNELRYAVLSFEAIVTRYLFAVPDGPISETLEWSTDVLVARSSEEQRIALRDYPKHSYQMSWSLLKDADWQYWQETLYKLSASEVTLPLWHYGTKITQDCLPGTNELFYDGAYTDLRPGSPALILSPGDASQRVVTLSELNEKGAFLSQPLVSLIPAGSHVVPCILAVMKDNSGPVLRSIDGSLSLDLKTLSEAHGLTRPGSQMSLDRLDGLIILPHRPVIDPPPSQRFINQHRIIDFGTGIRSLKTIWDHPQIMTTRSFRVERYGLQSLDWWYSFFEAVRGRQKTFLMSSFKNDLTVAASRALATDPILVEGRAYAETLYPDPRGLYQYLHIRFQNQDYYYKCTSAEYDGDLKATRISCEGAVPLLEKGATFSFLQENRLDKDNIKMTHHNTYTNIYLTFAAVGR